MDPTTIEMLVQGGFTALAGFLVWHQVKTTTKSQEKADAREDRMAKRIDDLEGSHAALTREAVSAQTKLADTMCELKGTLENRPCFHPELLREMLKEIPAEVASRVASRIEASLKAK